MPSIIVSKKMQNYRIFNFLTNITIGRDSSNEILLNSIKVSRSHAQIIKQKETFLLIDQGSKNAIQFEKKAVRELLLFDGITFKIADFTLTFVEDTNKNSDQGTTALRSVSKDNNETMLLVNFLKSEKIVDCNNIQKIISKHEEQILEICQISHRVSTLKDADEVLYTLFKFVLRILPAQGGFIAIKNNEGNLIYKNKKKFGEIDLDQIIDENLISQVLETGRIKHKQKKFALSRRRNFKHFHVCAPFILFGKVIGCCYIVDELEHILTISNLHIIESILLLGAVHYSKFALNIPIKNSKTKSRRLFSEIDGIINSPKMIRLFNDVKTMASINVPILLLGEPGTGKELVASALHSYSRRKGNYITLNCSAIPNGLFESEFFGSVKGAFHNSSDRKGKLELANNGTLFLDEIGDLDLVLQPKLLRFLENQELTRLGDTTLKKLDVRIIAATNQSLQTMIAQKEFRADLFQRLACFSLKIPPLKERTEEIEPLVQYFLSKFSKEYGWKMSQISSQALKLLLNYHWPGNIRELRNAVLRLTVAKQGSPISRNDVTRAIDDITAKKKAQISNFLSLSNIEKNHICSVLKHTHWNASETAKILGIARSTLYKKIEKYKIVDEENVG